jgi:hypothetical protein
MSKTVEADMVTREQAIAAFNANNVVSTFMTEWKVQTTAGAGTAATFTLGGVNDTVTVSIALLA